MARTEKSTTLYSHPFSKAYWRDAAAELKSTKMLVIAALMIALRVATKGLSVPIAPNLDLFNLASFINALSAMIIGPVLAIPAAFVSDFLGVMIWDGGNYFLPYALQEIASSLIWALLLYRIKINTWRVMLGRFLICLVVNIVMGSIIYKFYLAYMGTPIDNIFADMLTTTRMLKNLFMFPLESVVMTLFLSVLAPITYRMKLTYHNVSVLKFSRRQIVVLAVLFCIGVACVGGYMIYNYNTSNQVSWLSSADITDYNEALSQRAQSLELIQDDEVILINKVYKELGGDTTIEFVVYQLPQGTEATKWLAYRANKLPDGASLTQMGSGTASFVRDNLADISGLTVQYIQ